MIIIAAMSRDRVIGRDGALPWDVPEEYRHFLDQVAGQTVIMGRRSWEIFGADLTSTYNVVVSRSLREIPGAFVAPTIDGAVNIAGSFGKTVFSAGGAEIYQQTLPLAEKLYLSYIEGDFEGDAYFPAFDKGDWVVERREEHPGFEFVVYGRRLWLDLPPRPSVDLAAPPEQPSAAPHGLGRRRSPSSR